MNFVKNSLYTVQNQYKILSQTEKTVRVNTLNGKRRRFNFAVRNLEELAVRCARSIGLEEPVRFFKGEIDDLEEIDERKILNMQQININYKKQSHFFLKIKSCLVKTGFLVKNL
jgi:hypothetical protein